MHKRVLTIVISVGLASFASGVSAAESERLSLQEALRLASRNNPRVVETRQEAEAAKGRWIQTRTLPNPEVEVSTTELSQGLKGGSTVGDDSLSISQEMDVLGKFWLRGRAGKAEYQAAQHTLERVWSEVAFDVTRAYNALLLSRQQIGVSQEALEFTRRFLDQVQLRHSAGEVRRNELLRAQIEVAKAENAVLQAEKQVTLDAASLNILLGRNATASVIPSDELAYEPKDLDADRLLAQALDRRPDLKASESLVQARKKQWQLAIHDILDNPTVTAIGTRERGEERTAKVFGLAITLPLPFWNQNQGAIREARAELNKTEAERDALRREVGLEVISAIAEAQLAQRQVTVWKTGIEQANELVRLAAQQYRDGDINFLTYLEHLSAVKETKLAYIEALANYRTQLALVDQAVANTLVPDGKEARP